MRSLCLACYDVATSRRRYGLRRALSPYRVGGQRSVSECWLTHAELSALRATVTRMLDVAEDRFALFQLDPRMPAVCLGRVRTFAAEPFVIA